VYICVEGMVCDLCLGLVLLCGDPLNDCIVQQTNRTAFFGRSLENYMQQTFRSFFFFLSFFLRRKTYEYVCVCTLECVSIVR
jgi:hypothetical protein